MVALSDGFFTVVSPLGRLFYRCRLNPPVAALTLPDLTVYAFEPQPSLAYHIRRSIEANGLQRVRCLEVLLGQKDGESVLHIPSHSMHASIVPREERSRELRLPMRTLDSLIMSKEIVPTLSRSTSKVLRPRFLRGPVRLYEPTIPASFVKPMKIWSTWVCKSRMYLTAYRKPRLIRFIELIRTGIS